MPITNKIANITTDIANVVNKLSGAGGHDDDTKAAYAAVHKLYQKQLNSLSGGRLIKNPQIAKNFDDFMTGFKQGFFGTLKAATLPISKLAPELAPILGIANKVGDLVGNGMAKRGRPKKVTFIAC